MAHSRVSRVFVVAAALLSLLMVGQAFAEPATGPRPNTSVLGTWKWFSKAMPDHGAFDFTHQSGGFIYGIFNDVTDTGGVVGGSVHGGTFSLAASCGPYCTPDEAYYAEFKGKFHNGRSRMSGLGRWRPSGGPDCGPGQWVPFVAYHQPRKGPMRPGAPMTATRPLPAAVFNDGGGRANGALRAGGGHGA